MWLRGFAVGAGTALLQIVATDSVYFEAQVDEDEVRQIRAGQQVLVTSASVSDKPLRGMVADVIAIANAIASAQSRQFRVRVTIPNPPRSLTPGAFARGHIVKQQVINTLLLPEDALRQNNGQSMVMVAASAGDTAKVARRTVRMGMSSGGQTQILGGVRKGERVVIGSPALREGAEVRVASDSDTVASESSSSRGD